MFHTKCICQKIFEQICIGLAYVHFFLITMHKIDAAAEICIWNPIQYICLSFFFKKS